MRLHYIIKISNNDNNLKSCGGSQVPFHISVQESLGKFGIFGNQNLLSQIFDVGSNKDLDSFLITSGTELLLLK